MGLSCQQLTNQRVLERREVRCRPPLAWMPALLRGNDGIFLGHGTIGLRLRLWFLTERGSVRA